jgi:hypothetical protein
VHRGNTQFIDEGPRTEGKSFGNEDEIKRAFKKMVALQSSQNVRYKITAEEGTVVNERIELSTYCLIKERKMKESSLVGLLESKDKELINELARIK